MDNRKLPDNATAVIVAVLMLLTAYGNAWVMLAVSGLLLVGLFMLYRDEAAREGGCRPLLRRSLRWSSLWGRSCSCIASA